MNKDSKNCPGPNGLHCMTKTLKRDITELCKGCPSKKIIEAQVSAQRQELEDLKKHSQLSKIKRYREKLIDELTEMLKNNIRAARMEVPDKFKHWDNISLSRIALLEQIKFLSNPKEKADPSSLTEIFYSYS